jgi:hypothetical protein
MSTWFDEEQMRGDINQKMAEGIDNTSVVVVFVTKRYMEKVAGQCGPDECAAAKPHPASLAWV